MRPTIFLTLLLLARSVAPAAEIPLPETSGEPVRWQAEAADSEGWASVDDIRAEGGRYAAAARAGDELEFHFTAPEPMTVSLRPVWWLHGERLAARSFPDPLPETLGPGALATRDGLLFFTAPATGRVGVYDMRERRMLEPIETGGYPVDIVAAEDGRIYVANASLDRVAVIDPGQRAIVAEIAVAGRPWSMTMSGNRLLVACFTGRKVVAIDTARDEIVGEQDVAGVPLGITSADGVAYVERAPMVFDPETLAERLPDRTEYFLRFHEKNAAGWPAPLPAAKPEKRRTQHTLTSPEPGKLRYPLTGVGPEVDIISILEPALEVEKPSWLKDGPGPTAIDQAGPLAFFNAVEAGRVGVYDLENWKLLPAVDVGGPVSDLAVDDATNKVYALDVAADQVVVIDGGKPEILVRVDVPAGPAHVECEAGRAFVLSREDRTLTAIDTSTDQIVHSIALPFLPGEMRKVRLYPDYVVLPQFWQPAAADAPDVLLIDLPPMTLDSETLTPHAEPKRTKPFGRPAEVTFAEQVYSPEKDAHAIGVSGGAPVDTTAVTDPQRLPEPATLRPGDKPGTIVFRLDEADPVDWTRDIWVTPGDGTYVVNETEEFWEWNAPRIRVDAGEHVLRITAYSPEARLDAIELRRVADPALELTVSPLPAESHAEVSLTNYSGTFAHDEPSRFEIRMENAAGPPAGGGIHASIRDHRGEVVAEETFPADVSSGDVIVVPWDPPVSAPGVYRLEMDCATNLGPARHGATFVRLPKLEHPRLIFRKSEMEEIRERMERFPVMFRRYRQWLQWRLETDTLLPSLEELATRYPQSDYKNEANKWPLIAVQTMALLEDNEDFAEAGGDLEKYAIGGYKTFGGTSAFLHNCFPSITACLQDMQSLESEKMRTDMREQFDKSLGNSDLLAESLLSIREPLTPRMRAVAWGHGKWQDNIRRYFATHAGTRGGNWWLTHRTGCCCPLHGVARSLLFTRNFFAMDDMFDDVAFGGLFLHHAYVHPRENEHGVWPSFLHGGEGRGSCVMRSVVPALGRNPLLPDREIWNEIADRMNDPGAEEEDVLAILDGYPDHAAVVPLFIALGWFDPEMPSVEIEELPPTLLFDGEGEAVMQSDWSPERTRVYFTCGPRDMVYRWHAGHLEIMRNGELLLGSGSLGTDHGQPTPAWANTVVVGDDWRDWWLSGLGHRRGMHQLQVMDRHTSAGDAYVRRDQVMAGYAEPGGAGRGYTLGLHTHSRHPFIEEGRLFAWRTSPELDYAGGDMTHAWDPGEVVEATRQVAFLKPDIIVTYDRIQLADPAGATRWIAATGPELAIDGANFTVTNRDAGLRGRFVLPERAVLSDMRDDASLADFRWQVPQRVLSVEPGKKDAVVEYLVVMRTGEQDLADLKFTEALNADFASVNVETEAGPVSLHFRRFGHPGGSIVRDGIEEPLPDEVEDDYRRWSEDPRHVAWSREKRFEFLRIIP